MRSKRRAPLGLETPRVYVGPRASRSLEGGKGVLLGARRPAWVDVLEFDPQPGVSISRLIDSRFRPHPPWDVVGLSLSAAELRRLGERLLRDLVPGDVLMTEGGPRFHTGAEWARAILVGAKKKGRARRP